MLLVLITHSVSKTKRKEVLIGARGCVMHTALSELFLFGLNVVCERSRGELPAHNDWLKHLCAPLWAGDIVFSVSF